MNKPFEYGQNMTFLMATVTVVALMLPAVALAVLVDRQNKREGNGRG